MWNNENIILQVSYLFAHSFFPSYLTQLHGSLNKSFGGRRRVENCGADIELFLTNQRCLLPACIFANFLSRTSSEAIPISVKTRQRTKPRSLPARDSLKSIQLLTKAKMVRTIATQLLRFSCQKLIAHVRSLSPTPSTGKSPRRHTNDVNSHPNIRPYSTLFRKNYTMLATVFAAGFAWEMYEDPTIPIDLQGGTKD